MKDFKRTSNARKENGGHAVSEKDSYWNDFYKFDLSKQGCLERRPSIQTEKMHTLGMFSTLIDEKYMEASCDNFFQKKNMNMNVISQIQRSQQKVLDDSKKSRSKDENMGGIIVSYAHNESLNQRDLKKDNREKHVENVLVTLKQPELRSFQNFDFHRFLGQLKYRSSIPITKYMKSFIYGFSQKTWTIREKVKIVRDFFEFIYEKMRHIEPWINASEIEFDNAKEGMEKLIMTRLYSQTFSPSISCLLDDDITGHSDDLERDRIVKEKICMFNWIKEEHVEIPHTNLNQRFLELAGQELSKINTYRSPRDKILCILNCSKVIFGLLRHAGFEESADKFIPTLILIILKTNPENLISNIQYISRFRDPDKLSGESEYYFSSLIGAVAFIENLDKSLLIISDEEFEKNLEYAIVRIQEQKNKETDNKIKNTQSISSTILKPAKEYIASKSSNAIRNIQKPFFFFGKIFMDQNIEKSYQSITKQQLSSDQIPQNIVSEANSDRKKLIPSKANAGLFASRIMTFQETPVETKSETLNILSQMFPSIDHDVIGIIIDSENGKINPAIDILLSISSNI